MRDGHIARNPAEGLDLPTRERAPRRVWSSAQVRRFLAATQDHDDHALYALILATGCRIGEALALTWSMIDFDAGTAALRAHQRRQQERRRAAHTWDLRGYVFADAEGGPMPYEDALRRLHAVQRALGPDWPELTFHALRHTVASRLARNDAHPAKVRDLLGHKHADMALDVYTPTEPADLAAATAVLDDVVADEGVCVENSSKPA